MHYSAIKYCDIANGPGTRTSLFVSGCRNQCKGCFNPETWGFQYGDELSSSVVDEILESLSPEYIPGLTILGGEPLEPENQEGIFDLIKQVRRVFDKDKTIWIYTGFTYEELFDQECRANTPLIRDILSNVDVLVDGRFDEHLKNPALRFKGSSNQRIIDLPATLSNGSVSEWEDDEIFTSHSKEAIERQQSLHPIQHEVG